MSHSNRAFVLAPLYEADGPITVELRDGSDVYRRGDVEVTSPEAGDGYLLEYASCLVRWEGWLRKARVGTLKWIAKQRGHLVAGSIRATASVRSQLSNAGLLGPSAMWGDETTRDCERLAVWAACELGRRGHEPLLSSETTT